MKEGGRKTEKKEREGRRTGRIKRNRGRYEGELGSIGRKKQRGGGGEKKNDKGKKKKRDRERGECKGGKAEMSWGEQKRTEEKKKRKQRGKTTRQ
jgi:hypothetical protein